MAQSKYLTDPALLEQVERIKRREITRAQAAQALGRSEARLNVILAKTGLNKQLKSARNYVGDHLFQPNPETLDDYRKAVQKALQSRNIRAVHREFPHLNYVMLCRKVRKAKEQLQENECEY